MKKQNTFAGFFLIGIGFYFLLKQLQLPFLTDFFSLPTLLMILGIIFLVYGYVSKEYSHLFTGTILLGIGLHFFALRHYTFWNESPAVYLVILGLAFFVRFLKTRKGALAAGFLFALAVLVFFSSSLPSSLNWLEEGIAWIEIFWPVLMIAAGCWFLLRKK